MPNWIIASYYTINTGYEKEVEKLKESLRKLNLPYYIQPIKSQGSWVKNVHYHDQFILETMDLYPDKAIVSLDADVLVYKYPIYFDVLEESDNDLSIHLHYWKTRPVDQQWELQCGVMFFQNNWKARQFINACIARHKKNPQDRQQKNYKAVWEYWTKNRLIKWINLPPQYCKIFDLMRGVQDPIIEQFQASRRFRMEVDRMHRRKLIGCTEV